MCGIDAAVRHHRTRARPIGPPVVAVAGLIALVWWGMVIRIGHFDVDVFLRAGTAVRHGLDPYPAPGTAQVHSGYAFVYPYLMALLFAPLSWVRHADDLFVAGSVLAVLGGVRLAGARDWRVFALVVAASCTIIGFQMGTLNAPLFTALMLSWRWRDSPARCGAVVAVLVYSKLFLAPVLLWLLLAGRRRAAGVGAVVLAALFLAGQLVSPVGTTTYLGMLDLLARAEAPDGVSLTGLLVNAGAPMAAATWIARVGALGVLACCWLWTRRGHDERLLFTGAVVAALLASPIVWAHYLLLLVAPILVLSGPGPGPAEMAGPTRTIGAADPANPGEVAGPIGTTDPAGRLVGPVRSAPAAVFAASSWLLVTPHRSNTTDLVAAAVIGVPLVLSSICTGRDAAPAGARRRPLGARAILATIGAVVVLTLGAAALVCAAAHSEPGRVVGAYGTFVGCAVVIAWARRVTAPSGQLAAGQIAGSR